MSTQYYDGYGHCLEVPRLAVPQGEAETEGIAAINRELDALDRSVKIIMDQPWWRDSPQLCLFYPSTAGRYLNLLLSQPYTGYCRESLDGTIRAWVYDKETGRQVTAQDALSLAGVEEAALLDGLEQWVRGEPDQPGRAVFSGEIAGFRVRADGGVVFYLSIQRDYLEVDGEALEPWRHLYIWEDGAYTRYAPMSAGQGPHPLVPPEETDRLSPALWSQWYFAGEGPEGGFAHPAPTEGAVSESLRSLPEDMRAAYVRVLERLLQNDIAPDGSAAGLSWYAPERNQFAVWDVDGDGEEELIVSYLADVTAGDRGFVLGYDHETGTVNIQLEEYPLLTFFDNGTVLAGWSHSQGWGGQFWPYTLYQYQPGRDDYARAGSVDAWDRSLSDSNAEDGFPPYPQELDVSGTGFLYYINTNGNYRKSDPVDAAAYKAWLDPYVGDASVLLLPYLDLSRENIGRLRQGGQPSQGPPAP